MTAKLKIYVASSWKNSWHHKVVAALRTARYGVYDYRERNKNFAWKNCDPNWEKWDAAGYLEGLNHPDVRTAYYNDISALQQADVLLAIGPLGVSTAVELGLATGIGKKTILYLPEPQIDLMIDLMPRVADFRTTRIVAVMDHLSAIARSR